MSPEGIEFSLCHHAILVGMVVCGWCQRHRLMLKPKKQPQYRISRCLGLIVYVLLHTRPIDDMDITDMEKGNRSHVHDHFQMDGYLTMAPGWMSMHVIHYVVLVSVPQELS